MKRWRPWYIENSDIPIWLSVLSPIEIQAITLGPVVISKGEMSSEVKRHEAIHFQQYIELGFIGFPVLYLIFWLLNRLKGQSPTAAYYNILFEREAYLHQDDSQYLESRKRFSWLSL